MTLPITIGASARGSFAIDLVRDGPHALVGGTTGSGKSELLQTIIAGLALTQPPTRVTFLLVDYKGGAAFGSLVDLPHVVGFMSSIDVDGASLVRRSLDSLQAELSARERIFARHHARSIEEMMERSPVDAPARLVIIVDELAELARQVPEFVDGIVEIARKGRSLGLHLILATQRPKDAITPTILANTGLRIALRVADEADSVEIIGAPSAAHISRTTPGRAYARLGPGDVVEFQTAWMGGRSGNGRWEGPAIQPFQLGTDLGAPATTPVAPDEEATGPTDLERVVAAAKGAWLDLGLQPPRRPWLPPLPPMVLLADLAARRQPGAAVIGLVDDPRNQAQRPFEIDLERDGSLIVYGTSGSGKTGALCVAAASLAQSAAPQDLHLYGMDFSLGGLQLLDALPHTGSIVLGTDEERVGRLLRMLTGEIARRQAALTQAGAISFAGYLEQASAPLPRIVLLLDGYEAFASSYERVGFGEQIDALARVVSDGRGVGVHVLLSAERRASVPGRLAGAITRRLVLRLADPSEYAMLGIPRDMTPTSVIPLGRGFDQDGLEVQCAVLTLDNSPQEQQAALGRIAQGYPTARVAPRIGVLPSRVASADLPEPSGPLRAVLGIGNTTLEPWEVDLSQTGFLVLGPRRSGRSTSLATLVRSLRLATPGLELHLIAPEKTPLTENEGWASVATDPERGAAIAQNLLSRFDRASAVPACLVVDDAESLLEGPASDALAKLTSRGRTAVHVVAAAEVRAAGRAFGGWLLELRKDRHGIFLQPGPETTGDALSATLPRAPQGGLLPGRGYHVLDGMSELVQVAVSE